MLIEVPENVLKKKVIKRDGKKVDFEGAKIALAIQKGFYDIIDSENVEDVKYSENDINKVYFKVLNRISKIDGDKIKIEQIQDLIEEELLNNKYQDVYEAFSFYREKRNQSRKLFFDEKKQHKFLKALENLGMNSSNIEETKKDNLNEDTSMGTMLQYGSTISKQFAMTYLIKKKFADAHENGDIYIHNLEFLPMGTTNCSIIDLNKLFENRFIQFKDNSKKTEEITKYVSYVLMAIQLTQNDQHGGQCISAFDFNLAPGVLRTFKTQLRQMVFDYLELNDFDKFIAVNGIERDIEKIQTIEIDTTMFDKYCRKSEELKRMFRLAYKKAYEKTSIITYEAMQSFINNLNNIKSRVGGKIPLSTIEFGTDISPEGRMISRSLLRAIEDELEDYNNLQSSIYIFKIKEGINFNEKDKNYDLLELACNICKKIGLPNFAFIDAPFNIKTYDGSYNTEVGYIGNYSRILENIVDENKQIVPGRGNLSITTINLPRLGIKHRKNKDIEGFFNELEEKMDLIKDQLIERFEIQYNKRVYNFPFLLNQSVWIDSEKLKETDNLRKVLKHGTLSIGFIGLAECLKALIGKHHGESKEAQELGIKIVEFMRKKCDEYSIKYNLNINLSSNPKEEMTGEFIKLDQAIYGKLKDITDKENYTDSFHIPINYKISVEDKINKEAPYHKYTNGGHIMNIKINNKSKNDDNDIENYLKIIRLMKKSGVGYARFELENMKNNY